MAKRGSESRTIDRVSEVFRMLRSGVTKPDLVRIGTEIWQVSIRQIEKYITRANKMYRDYGVQNQEEFLKDSLEKLDILYIENFLARDRKECRRVLLAKNRLLGFEKLNLHLSGINVDDILGKLKETDLENQRKK